MLHNFAKLNDGLVITYLFCPFAIYPMVTTLLPPCIRLLSGYCYYHLIGALLK
jgi:hypothetical protein